MKWGYSHLRFIGGGVVQVVEARVFLGGLESCPICRSPSRTPLPPPLVLSPARPPRPHERGARLTGQPTEAAGRRERREEERGRGDEAQERSASCVGEKSQFKPVRASAHWLQESQRTTALPGSPGPSASVGLCKTFSAFASLGSGAAAG